MRFLAFAFAICLACPVWAELQQYRLDPAESEVGFTYQLSGFPKKGTMPVVQADLSLDFARLNRSQVAVVLDATGTTTGLAFAAQALKGPEVLDVATYPNIRFVSRKIDGSLARGAQVTGDVTIRDVTRPLTLEARLFRPEGTQSDDLQRLIVILTGAIDRTDFGAVGFADLVGDHIDIRIQATIEATAR